MHDTLEKAIPTKLRNNADQASCYSGIMYASPRDNNMVNSQQN